METQALQRIKKFSFPLNVYAYLLAMESGVGDVVNLHFGWFDNVAEPIAVAQERATRELLAWLPTPPARLLEVGAGVGTTLALLLERGYDACGITPDGSQIDFMRDRHGKDFPVEPVRFEDMALPPEKFDGILFQESGQYIPVANSSCVTKSCRVALNRASRCIAWCNSSRSPPNTALRCAMQEINRPGPRQRWRSCWRRQAAIATICGNGWRFPTSRSMPSMNQTENTRANMLAGNTVTCRCVSALRQRYPERPPPLKIFKHQIGRQPLWNLIRQLPD